MTAGTIDAPTAEAAAEAEAALAAEQAALDAESTKPDRPEGAADDPDVVAAAALAAELAEASGVAADKAAGQANTAKPGEQLAWEEIVGGDLPTATKIRLQGGAIEVQTPDGGLKKGSSHVLQVEVVVAGVGIEDSIDSETHDVTATTDTRKLKIRSARFIDTPTD